jgi:hypothetical protein
MSSIGIVLTEDELVRLYEVGARLQAGGEWLGDIVELWTEFRHLLLGHIANAVSPEVVKRLNNVIPALAQEAARAVDLEALYETETQ